MSMGKWCFHQIRFVDTTSIVQFEFSRQLASLFFSSIYNFNFFLRNSHVTVISHPLPLFF